MAVSVFPFLRGKKKDLGFGCDLYLSKCDVSVPIVNDFYYVQHNKSNKQKMAWVLLNV